MTSLPCCLGGRVGQQLDRDDLRLRPAPATIDTSGTANDAKLSLDAVGRFKTRELGPIGPPTTTDTYSYAGPGETVLRIANSGGTTTDSIMSPSGDRLAVKEGTTLNWLLPDLHGNVAAAEDNSERRSSTRPATTPSARPSRAVAGAAPRSGPPTGSSRAGSTSARPGSPTCTRS